MYFGLVAVGAACYEELRRGARCGRLLTFTGWVPDENMLDMLSTADVYVNSDIANEMNDKSTMNKVMEYMALAKPTVQFDLTERRRSAPGCVATCAFERCE